MRTIFLASLLICSSTAWALQTTHTQTSYQNGYILRDETTDFEDLFIPTPGMTVTDTWRVHFAVTEIAACAPVGTRFAEFGQIVDTHTGDIRRFVRYYGDSEDDEGNPIVVLLDAQQLTAQQMKTNCIVGFIDSGPIPPDGYYPTPGTPIDFDGDNIPDDQDPDDDNDGVPDVSDSNPRNPRVPNGGGGPQPPGPQPPGPPGPGDPQPPGPPGPGDPNPEPPGPDGGVIGSDGDPNGTHAWQHQHGNRINNLLNRARIAYSRFIPSSEGDYVLRFSFNVPGLPEPLVLEAHTNPSGDDALSQTITTVRLFVRSMLKVFLAAALFVRIWRAVRQVF